jgi:hypothetical protein
LGRAVAARTQGDDYQARLFCLELCRLFDDRPKVVRVQYEAEDSSHFDDVVVHYDAGMLNSTGGPLYADYYQVKFHVDLSDCITCAKLIDPGFINSETTSLLQRVQELQRALTSDGWGYRFIFYTNWQPCSEDLLGSLIKSDYSIRWDRLRSGGPKSKYGLIRKMWREHLGLQTDDELEIVLRPLRIYPGHSLEELGRVLNFALRGVGLEMVPDGSLLFKYDDLISKLHQRGEINLTAAQARKLLQVEGLWKERVMQEPEAYRIGIRSFYRWAEDLGDKTDALLSLLEFFDGRFIKAPELWQTEVYLRIEDFLAAAVRGKQRCVLHLHAHASIAVASGYLLPTKRGVEVAPVQATSRGLEIWRPDNGKLNAGYPLWQNPKHEERVGDGPDVALALGVTHNVLNDVRHYVQANLPTVGRILFYTLEGGPGGMVVQDGTHAKLLADALATDLRARRTVEERGGRLHIFPAAPNGLLFFVGQLMPGFGPTTLYEFDFDTSSPGAYQPSFSFPVGAGEIGRSITILPQGI